MCEKDLEFAEKKGFTTNGFTLNGFTINGQESTIPQNQAEPDLLPELCRYRDEGCELAGSCLHCHLPKCVYDKPGGRRRALKRMRDREMVRLFRAGGKSVKELASKFKVSTRTVQRALVPRSRGEKIRNPNTEIRNKLK